MNNHRERQKDKVLKHIKEFGSITSIEAFDKYRITRLSDRIFNLRNEGIDIITTMVTKKTDHGHETFARYTLNEQ